MSGFKNVKDGIKHFFQRLGGDIEDTLKLALELLHPSVSVVEKAIHEHGADILKAVAAAMASAATSTFATASGTQADKAKAAGQAALAAGEAAAVAAGIKLGKDVLHALATSVATTEAA